MCPQTRTNEITIIIPAYNEQNRIAAVLSNFCQDFPGQRIIVVCNGCADDTARVVKSLCPRYPQVELLNFADKLGKGGAIIEGMKAASGDIIGFVDSDESTDTGEVKRIIEALSGADGVIASRKLKNSRILTKQPLPRRIASKAFNIFVRTWFGLDFRDTQCGAKFFTREAIKSVLPELRTKGFEFDVELLWKLKKKGYRIVEFPITWGHSKGSTFNMFSAPRMFISLVKLRLHPLFQGRKL